MITSCFQRSYSLKNDFLWKSRMYHPYHIVDMRPWPISGASGSLLTVGGLASYINGYGSGLLQLGIILLLSTIIQWWRDVTREATFQGKHTHKVEVGLRSGMLLFIVREVCFFFSFFWAYFHSSLSPSSDIGNTWPPTGVVAIHPFEVPLLNTTLLLSRGATITWAHFALTLDMFHQAHFGLACTVALGLAFAVLQALEYGLCSFTISDSVFGRAFYIATGFHGIHVLIGTLFIMVIWSRHNINHFSSSRHLGFEASAWYWHFVDVVWLFLYLVLYWWGY